ncbi:MAG: sporulation protein YqfD, partial [Clostridia bacterium]|nr:sporulation protein YqfD [Clostridia bacterium]
KILESLDLEITISPKNKLKYESLFQKNGIVAKFSKSKGLIPFLRKYEKRYGIFLGALFLLLSVYASSLFVWRIDIEGNKNVPDEEIILQLENAGFSLGKFIPNVNYDTIHNKFLLASDNISWVSINISGNVATVHVRERQKDSLSNKTTYSNVIAKYDAQIALVQLYNGKKVVSIGDVVKKGDLLITGVLNSQSQGVRYAHADGVIMAYVNKPIFIKMPLKTTEKVYTGKVYEKKSVKIFSKPINFLLKYRNYSEFCDKIERKEKLCLFGAIELPIEITTTYFKEYETVEVTHTYSQTVDLAFSKLRAEMDIQTKDAELISKKLKTYYDSEAFYIECNLYCLENIASVVEFEVE